jgi:hypothetical protein
VERAASDGGPVYVVVGERGRARLDGAALRYQPLAEAPACRITRLDAALLSPARRETACPRVQVVRVEGASPRSHGP